MYNSQHSFAKRSNSFVQFSKKSPLSAGKTKVLGFVEGKKEVLSDFSRFSRTACGFHCKKVEVPEVKTEPPYVILRNGVTCYYNPVEPLTYRANLISPFGSTFRGSKIKERNENGNMFAVHSARTLPRAPVYSPPRPMFLYFKGRSKKR